MDTTYWTTKSEAETEERSRDRCADSRRHSARPRRRRELVRPRRARREHWTPLTLGARAGRERGDRGRWSTGAVTAKRKRTRPQRTEARARELGAAVVVSARYPQELLAAIDAARGDVPRQRWLVAAAEAALAGRVTTSTPGRSPPR